MKKLGRLINTEDELFNNLLQVDTYLNNSTDDDYDRMTKLIANGSNFVVYKSGNKMHFAPSRFIGYLKNDLITHLVKHNGKDGSLTSNEIDKILGCSRKFDNDLEQEYLTFCKELGVKPKNMIKAQRKYWVLDKTKNNKYLTEYYEGSVQQALINRYERNPLARKECIGHYGYTCQICGFNFEKVYGKIGAQFIHVHHLTPIAEIGKNYKLDPIRDLIPVCPNCHAMLHRKSDNDKRLTVTELKALIKQ